MTGISKPSDAQSIDLNISKQKFEHKANPKSNQTSNSGNTVNSTQPTLRYEEREYNMKLIRTRNLLEK